MERPAIPGAELEPHIKPSRKPHLLSEIWEATRPVLKLFIQDAAFFCFILIIVLLSYFGLKVLKWAGYSQERIVVLETLHYWAYLTALTEFLVYLVWELFRHLFLRT